MNYTSRSQRIDEFVEAFLHSPEESKVIFPLYPGEIRKLKENYPELGVIEKGKRSPQGQVVCVIYKLP